MSDDVHSPDQTENQELLTPSEAATYLRLSKSLLDKRRVCGGGPPFLRPVPRKILYRKSDLDNWANSHKYTSTAEYKRSK
jgi:hypothetical protein